MAEQKKGKNFPFKIAPWYPVHTFFQFSKALLSQFDA